MRFDKKKLQKNYKKVGECYDNIKKQTKKRRNIKKELIFLTISSSFYTQKQNKITKKCKIHKLIFR